MRGQLTSQPNFVSLINVDNLIRRDHPIRRIKKMVDEILRSMSASFDEMYSEVGRSSIPPETLLKAKLLQALYTVRSDRQLCERLQTDLLFRWFIDLDMDQAVFDPSSFSQNQQRLLGHQVAEKFFAQVVQMAHRQGWVSDDHFSVDGTLIEAWASLKSFRPNEEPAPSDKDSNRWTDFHGEKRSNETHRSRTDPEAKLMRKGPGKEAKLSFAGHAVMENRHGLCVKFDVRPVIGESESKVAVEQIQDLKKRGFTPKTVGGDKGYHTENFVEGLQKEEVTAHPAIHQARLTIPVIVDAAHEVSQKFRKRIEEIFGWGKTIGGLRKTRYKGVERTHASAQYIVSALNLLRMAKLQGA